MDAKLQWALAQIMEKVGKDFHGEAVLVFKDGVLQCLKVEQVSKPPQTI